MFGLVINHRLTVNCHLARMGGGRAEYSFPEEAYRMGGQLGKGRKRGEEHRNDDIDYE